MDRLDVVADHEVVAGADGDIEMAERDDGEEAPRRGVLAGDFVNGVERQLQEVGVAGCRQADPAGLAGDGGGLAEPGAGLGEMGEGGSVLAGRDRDGEAAGDQAEHGAGRVADRVDRVSGGEMLEAAAVHDGALERRRGLAEPATAEAQCRARRSFRPLFSSKCLPTDNLASQFGLGNAVSGLCGGGSGGIGGPSRPGRGSSQEWEALQCG